MVWYIITLIFSTFLDIVTIGRQSNFEKDLEILVLRQQISILQRKLNFPIRPSRVDSRVLFISFNLKPFSVGIVNSFGRNGLIQARTRVVVPLSTKNSKN